MKGGGYLLAFKIYKFLLNNCICNEIQILEISKNSLSWSGSIEKKLDEKVKQKQRTDERRKCEHLIDSASKVLLDPTCKEG